MPAIQYPLINGNRYDFTSIEFFLDNILFFGFTSMNYKDSLEPGEVRGNAAQVLGRTRGKYVADASFELPVLEYDQLTSILVAKGLGYKEQSFDLRVSYSEANSPVITDELIGARIKTSDHGNKGGNEPSMVKCDLTLLYIIKNGKLPIGIQNFRR